MGSDTVQVLRESDGLNGWSSPKDYMHDILYEEYCTVQCRQVNENGGKHCSHREWTILKTYQSSVFDLLYEPLKNADVNSQPLRVRMILGQR